MQEMEKVLQKMTLTDFERRVPTFARIRVEECRNICDFIGLNFEHFPYLDDDFKQKLLALYKAHGATCSNDEHLLNAATIPSPDGDKAPPTLWDRSFYGKYLGPGVFFFNLGCGIDLLCGGAKAKIATVFRITELVGDMGARNHSKAMGSLMGVAAYIGLRRVGLVRDEVVIEMMQQVEADHNFDGPFSPHVYKIAKEMLEKEKDGPALSKEGFVLFLKKTLEIIRKHLGNIAQEISDGPHSTKNFEDLYLAKAFAELDMILGGLSKGDKEAIRQSLRENMKQD